MSLKASRAVDRVTLDQSAKEALVQMMETLRQQEPCINLSPSNLGSLIVSRYAKGQFEKDKEDIIRHFFNSREYLKKLLKEAHTSEEMSSALRLALSKVESAPSSMKRRKRMTKSGESLSAPSSNPST